MLGYILYRIGETLAWALGRRGAYGLAIFCADVKLFFSIRNRRIIRDNLSVVFSQAPPEVIHKRIRAVFRNFAKSISDFMRMRSVNEKFIRRHVSLKGLENLKAGLARGKGVLLVSSHMGNWELGAAALSSLGYRINVVALAHAEKQVNKYFLKQRSSRGIHVINARFAVRRCIELLKKNEIVAILGDKDFTGSQGVLVKFFDRPAEFPKGPSALALKTGAALVPIFNIRTNQDDYELTMHSPIDIDQNLENKKASEAVTQKFADVLEEVVRAHAEQWTLFLPMWPAGKPIRAA